MRTEVNLVVWPEVPYLGYIWYMANCALDPASSMNAGNLNFMLHEVPLESAFVPIASVLMVGVV